MAQPDHSWVWIGALALGCLVEQGAIAQITPDSSLGEQRSSLASERDALTIRGGAKRDTNLFHSFSEFNVGEGQQVYFANPADVERIISRVTGNNPSTILGTLGVSGSADLVLLNPNGIIFGPNARLDVSGSFLATTADALVFKDFAFSASDPQAPPLLTINAPIGLQTGNPGSIVNRSQVSNGSGIGLQVPGQTLGLIGGELSFEGGSVTAPQGRIELGSVGDRTFVGLSSTDTGLSPQYNNVQVQDIHFSQQARVDASGQGGGTIQVKGKNITLTEGSSLSADTLGKVDGDGIVIEAETLKLDAGAYIATATFNAGDGGNVTIRASESIDIVGTGLEEYQQVFVRDAAIGTLTLSKRGSGFFGGTEGAGQAGDISLETHRLNIRNGGTVTVNLLGQGEGGNVSVKASDLELRGGSISMAVLRGGTRNAGTISVETDRLRMLDAGLISNSTVGEGNGGTIAVDASDSIFIQGFPKDSFYSSGFATISIAGAEGVGGKIDIDTSQLTIQHGGGISTNSGAVALRTSLSPDLDGGPAGSIDISASKKVEVNGTSTDGKFSSRIVSQSSSTSRAGEVKINTKDLIVRDEAEVGVDGSKGNAGNLDIIANSIRLSNQGKLTAATASGQGGNIDLQIQDLLVLRNGSSISATADGTGNGGNIDIDTKFLIAVSTEDSNIVANASTGRGGNIKITAQGIFGIESRDRRTALSDITASSELGLEGIVEINTSEIEPGEELGELPQEIVNVAQLIERNICTAGEGSEFVLSGRGGLPDSPQEAFGPDNVWEDWRIDTDLSASQAPSPLVKTYSPTPDKLIEARGWVMTDNGNVVLVAESALAQQSSRLPPPQCQ